MKQQFCKVKDHEQEEQIYICNQLQCIDLKDNKLLCQKCLCNHNGLNYNKLKEKAVNSFNEYNQILKSEIEDSEKLKKNFDDQITKMKEQISKFLDTLNKKTFSFVDNQSLKLITNQNKAQQLMQYTNPSLDTLIFFALFSNQKLQNKLNQTKQQMNRIINDLSDDLNLKIREYLEQPNINEYKIIEHEVHSFQIESIFKQKLPYGYCNEHFSQKSSICIHKECLQENITYHCLRCCKTTHIQHFQNDYIEEYEKLKQIQKIKLTFQENEKIKVKENAQKLIDDLIRKLKIEQKEQYMKYIITIENIKHLEQQFYINLSIQDNKYIFGDLLISLITIKDEEIQSQINHEYQNLEEKLKYCKIQEEQKFQDKCNLIQSYSDIIYKLQKDKQELQQLVYQKDQLIKNNSLDCLLSQIKLININIGELKNIDYKVNTNFTQKIDQIQQQQQENYKILQYAKMGETVQKIDKLKDDFHQKIQQLEQRQEEYQQMGQQIIGMLKNILEICTANRNRNNGWNGDQCQIS
ncbi:unnamed protein product [Paramecium pentaurelia]|uniref:Uncharacterized protein n=1 Tax=Paramecium pentaurelia TaxID=43138 RepID=A0A8S1U1H5_9CILI|nr:unnamed protein product [Paramecium pentaurelia]